MSEVERDFGKLKITDWKMKHVCAKFIPRVLTAEKKKYPFEIAHAKLEMGTHNKNELVRNISFDESLVYGCDPATKQHCSKWKAPSKPRLKKARQCRGKVKSILIVFPIKNVLCTTDSTINKEL